MMEPRPAQTYRHPIRVTWGDCDPAKIAYTGRIPCFGLEAIEGWWAQRLGVVGWYEMELDRNLGTPFVRLELDIRAPVTPRHELVCHVWPAHLGTTSVAFRVDGEQSGKTCFSMRSVSVFTVADRFSKQVPPEEIRQILQAELAASAKQG